VRWPFRRERRQGYGDAILAAAEARAHGTVANIGRTAAAEACSGLLSRALAAAVVESADGMARAAVTPAFLALAGRALVREGELLAWVRMTGDAIELRPSGHWTWLSGSDDPATWRVQASFHGPASTVTRNLAASEVAHFTWGVSPAATYEGRSPGRWASLAASLDAGAEKTLSDETNNAPLAQLVTAPLAADGQQREEYTQTVGRLLASARGKAFVAEIAQATMGPGSAHTGSSIWKPARLGAEPPASLVQAKQDAFDRYCAAAGCPPSLFDRRSDGTARRESLRLFHMTTVLPVARMIEAELSVKLAAPVTLRFDGYAKDMVSRAQVFAKLAAAEGITPQTALRIAGLIEEDDA